MENQGCKCVAVSGCALDAAGVDLRKLYKKIDATSKTRFYASRRLKRHARYSGYVIAGISLVLIFISLMQSLKLGQNISSSYITLMQVFSSVLILAYSLSIEKNNYSGRAEKLYSCAAALGKLKIEVTPYLHGSAKADCYDKFQNDYHAILSRYEAEAVDDFRVDHLRAMLDMPEDYIYDERRRSLEQRRIAIGLIWNFFHYYVILFVTCSLLYWVVFFKRAAS